MWEMYTDVIKRPGETPGPLVVSIVRGSEKFGADIGKSRPGDEYGGDNGKDTNQGQNRDYISTAGDIGGTGGGFHKVLLGFGGIDIAVPQC